MPAIQKNFEIHDQFQFEMKLDYWLDHGLRDDYQVDLYLFLPNSLDLNSQSYPQEAFYDDIKNHVRLKTPECSLAEIISPDSGRPGQLLLDSFEALKTDPTRPRRRLVEYHTKMVVSIALRAMQNEKDSCLAHIRQGKATGSQALIRDIDSVLDLIRKLPEQIPSEVTESAPSQTTDHSSDHPSYRLATTLESADEYLTFETTQNLLALLSALDEAEEFQSPEFETTRQVLLKAINEQVRHRAEKGFPELRLHDQGRDETVLFRRSIFKKFFRSPLFLNQQRKPEGKLAGQVAMGFAAGLSMVFATLIAFLAQKRFGNFTLPLFVALVVGYVFKDRIKELTKIYLEKWLSKRMSDSKTHFFDQENRRMGVCRETVRYVSSDQVPRNILEIRDKNHLTEVANFWHSEQIIHYRKQVSLFRRPLTQTNPGYETAAVNDIIRYNVGKLLKNMDEPEKELLTLNEDGSVGPVAGSRIYKINLVLRLSGGTREQFARFRLILDRDGIRRMEEVSV